MARNDRLTRRGALRTGATAVGLLGLGAGTGVAQSDGDDSNDHCYYQVDFVAGDPIALLGKRKTPTTAGRTDSSSTCTGTVVG